MKRILPLFLLCWITTSPLFGQKTSQPFEFQFENKTLRGLIEQAETRTSQSLVILIPGYGETNFVEGNWYAGLRDSLLAAGLTVCFWDKMGCGNSEGEFDANQPVENSADEAIAAIAEIKRLNIPGSETIGLWGISRAGWICPLINARHPIDFWISVSGTDDKENYGYLLKSNLIIAGKEEPEAERLYQAWMLGHKRFCTGDSLEALLEAIQPLREDSLCQQLFGYNNEEGPIREEDRTNYWQEQENFTSKGHFDHESGLWVYIDDFEQTLSQVNCPVLALFGENDSQVDWRKTKALYETTITKNPKAELTTKVFQQCNHNLQSCVSCAYGEDLSTLGWQACDGYYQTMIEWLKEHGFVE